MKILIIFEDKEILIETSNEISIKLLKKQLSSHISIPSENLKLMNEKEILDESYVINKENESKKYILFKPLDTDHTKDQIKDFVLEDNSLEDMLMKVTGAKKKVTSKKAARYRNNINQFYGENEPVDQYIPRYPPQYSNSFARLRQEFHNILSSNNAIRESLNQEENINNVVSSNAGINSLYSQFNLGNFSQNNPILNTIINRNQLDSSNIVRQNNPFINNNESNINSSNVVNNSSNNQNFNFGRYIPQQIPFRRPSAQPDLQGIKNLVEMGFSEDQAKRALAITGNNLNASADLLLSNDNLDDLNFQPYSMIRMPSNISFKLDYSANTRPQGNLVNNNNSIIGINNNISTNIASISNNNFNPVNNLMNSTETNSNLSILNGLVINNNNNANNLLNDNFSYLE